MAEDSDGRCCFALTTSWLPSRWSTPTFWKEAPLRRPLMLLASCLFSLMTVAMSFAVTPARAEAAGPPCDLVLCSPGDQCPGDYDTWVGICRDNNCWEVDPSCQVLWGACGNTE